MTQKPSLLSSAFLLGLRGLRVRVLRSSLGGERGIDYEDEDEEDDEDERIVKAN